MEVSAGGRITWVPGEDQGGGTAAVVVRVLDNGVPELEARQEFFIAVAESNLPPVLGEIPVQRIQETNRFRRTLVAADPDVPDNGLRFAKISGPATLTVSPSGEIAWDPGETDGGRSHAVTVEVVDDGIPSLRDQMQFTIEVAESNEPPRIVDIPTDPIPENEFYLHVLSVADPDVPLNGYQFELISGPPGLTMSPDGLIEWMPSEDQGPSTNAVIVKVTDTGLPPLSATNQFDLVVLEVNTPPRWTPPARQTIEELVPWTLALQAVDSDLPANRLKYTLNSGPPGLSLTEDGVVSWQPTELQGPSTNDVSVSVTDGVPGSRPATGRFTVVVPEVNHPPVLEAVPDSSELPGELVHFFLSASDPDLPRRNALRFEVVAGESRASVDPDTGEFYWPVSGSGPMEFTIRVVDNGVPPRFSEQSFTIRVGGPELTIRVEGSQIVLEYPVRDGWKYTLMGLRYDQAGAESPTWNAVSGTPTRREDREIIRLPMEAFLPGQMLRVYASP